ncbi:MAG: hypothetical protein GF353_03295 [Candidatus Lokiarchaeota archaeon]|nr:hypothetical protein [Candidatus Lokiarchaeota archaeon]
MFIVEYRGHFGFIKPWTAVRDELTYSQQFLTPSIIMGIEQKLFPELLGKTEYEPKIVRHKLQYSGINQQQEQTQTKALVIKKREGMATRPRSILKRGVLINPKLFLAFQNEKDSSIACSQHICLCRNEDILLPVGKAISVTEEEFDALDGFELRFEQSEMSFLVGYNRFRNSSPMFGKLEITGNPVQGN